MEVEVKSPKGLMHACGLLALFKSQVKGHAGLRPADAGLRQNQRQQRDRLVPVQTQQQTLLPSAARRRAPARRSRNTVSARCGSAPKS